MSYYVSPTGMDTNPGTIDQPWKTIQKAANMMAAGNTVIVLAGNYDFQRVNVTKSGSDGNPIIYQAQGTVIIHGGFNITANYITVSGFEIADTGTTSGVSTLGTGVYIQGSNNLVEQNYIHDVNWIGIYTDANSTNNTIRNNRLYHDGQNGITINGNNNLIEGNEVWDSIQYPKNLLNPPSYVDADGMRFFGTGHIFRGNKIHDIRINPPENVSPHIDCFQTWEDSGHVTASYITFEGNYCENLNEGMYAFMLEGGANHLTIKNNIFRTFGGVNATDTSAPINWLYVYNNLWANDLSFGSANYPKAIDFEDVQNAYIINNIFYNQPYQTVDVIGATAGIQVDYNLAFNSNGTTPSCVVWGNWDTCLPLKHDIWGGNPLFVDPGAGNYNLKSGSPAIDSGENLTAVGVIDDFANDPRPEGAGYDMGVYEEAGSTATKPTSTSQVTSTDSSITIQIQPTGTIQPTSVNTSTPVSPSLTPTKQTTSVNTSTPVPPLATPTKQQPAPVSTTSQITLQFNPVADAYVSSAHPNTNYGTGAYLDASNSPVMRSYLRFNVKGLNGKTIKSAALRLRTYTASRIPILVRNITKDTWTEKGVDYNNRPSIGTTTITGPQSYNSATWISIDVTKLVKGEGSISMELTLKNTATLVFYSRESGSNAPQLIINTAP
jgi:hypothetical protein